MFSDSSVKEPFRIALISTGVETSVVSAAEKGWAIQVQGDRLQMQQTHRDTVGRGTDLALCLVEHLNHVSVIGLDIFNGQSKTTSTLLLKSMEKAIELGCDMVVVCVPSFNEERANRFIELCKIAADKQIHIVAGGVRERVSYPSSIAGVLSALSHADCQERMYVYDPSLFGPELPYQGYFLLNGWWQGRYWGAEMATVRLASWIVRLRQSGVSYADIPQMLSIRAFLPFEEFGFV